MSKFRGEYTQSFRDVAVREVLNNSRPIVDVARELGLVEQTLRNWVAAHRERLGGNAQELTVSERAKLKQLEKEVRELRMENEFLGKQRPSSPTPRARSSPRTPPTVRQAGFMYVEATLHLTNDDPSPTSPPPSAAGSERTPAADPPRRPPGPFLLAAPAAPSIRQRRQRLPHDGGHDGAAGLVTFAHSP